MAEAIELRGHRDIHRGYVDVFGGQVHYAATRELGHGIPIVMLHQTASSWLGYVDVIAELADDYQVIALDTPGFGGSDPLVSPVTIARLGEALLAAIDGLEIGQFWLYGHHTGATLAAWVASHHPTRVRKLILSGPPYLDDAIKHRMLATLDPGDVSQDGSHLMRAWERHLRLAGGDVRVSQRELVLYFTSDKPELTYRAVMDAPFPGWLRAIGCPTYVMGGDVDTIRSGLKPTHDALPDSEIEVVEGAGIYMADEVPELVADRMRRWFR